MTSPQILLLYIAMGGLIAYLGDWLGRKMGKKRLRIGKLRPRHTATFFTVLMGMLIPLATTYGLVTQSSAVRQWIVEGPDLARQKQHLETEIEENQVSVAKLKNEAATRQSQLASVESMRNSAAAARDKAVNERNEERGRLAEARMEIAAAERREQQVSARVETLRRNETSLQSSVTKLVGELDASHADLEVSKTEAKRLYEEIEGFNQNSIKLAQEIRVLEGERDRQARRAEDARKDADAAEADVERYFSQIIDLRGTIAEIEGSLAGAAQGIEAVRTSSVVFRKNEELARLAVPAGLTREQARAKIDEVTKIADVAAKERGVRPNASGRAAALDVRLRRLPDGNFMTITVEDQMNAFINEIAGNTQDLLLLATSFYNFFASDQTFVPINFNIYPNRVVFDEGEMVAETIIDGTKTEEEILDAVIFFLRTAVRSSAEGAGMIPVQGQDVSIGEITYGQMTNLVRRIRQRAGPAKVVAEADRRTKSAEPLTLRFKVQSP
ncbi:MAG: DUF3084 domain-containing protein [Armatimonadota bacterium]|nr:DUF3084 domain-containing protein [Armatimonadota bacterium]